MRIGVLNQEDLSSLLVQSSLSEIPVMDLVRVDNDPQPLVAVGDWLMPLSYFVISCFWWMSSTTSYHRILSSDPHKDDVMNWLNQGKFLRKPTHQSHLAYATHQIHRLLRKKDPGNTNSERIYTWLEAMIQEATAWGHCPHMD